MDATTVIGVPVYTLAKYSGMGASPGALRAAGLLTALAPPLLDEGDIELTPLTIDSSEENMKNFDHFKKATAKIQEQVGRLTTDRVFLAGGECSYVVGNLAGLSRVFEGKPGMLWMDAHGDFNTPETSPSGYIGGMCLAMACGKGPKIGDEVEKSRPMLAEERLVHVGSRALDQSEVLAFNSSPAKLFTAQHVKAKGAREVAEEAARHLANRSDWIVCHLDVDVVDPSIIPAVNYPTPDGLTVEEVVELVAALRRTEKLRAVELAAYNASFDKEGSSARTIVDMLRRIYR